VGDKSISRYPVPALDDLPDDILEMVLAVQEKAGFVPNVFLTLALRPDELRAFMAYHDVLMLRDGGLTAADREMIVVATSGANSCQYCVVAHCAILRIRARQPTIADQVAINYRKADITPLQTAMLDFALKVSNESHRSGTTTSRRYAATDFPMRISGTLPASRRFFGMSNRMANFTSMRPNDEFYMMGRS
jgi:uncharacterized peroxidase-related enzyme